MIDANVFGALLAGFVGFFIGLLFGVPTVNRAARLNVALERAQGNYFALRNTGMVVRLTIGGQKVLFFTNDNGKTWWRCQLNTNAEICIDHKIAPAEMKVLHARAGAYEVFPQNGKGAQFPEPMPGDRIGIRRALQHVQQPGLRPASQPRFPA